MCSGKQAVLNFVKRHPFLKNTGNFAVHEDTKNMSHVTQKLSAQSNEADPNVCKQQEVA